MNPYHSLTDDQLAEWHMLTVKVERLTADLAESRKATESVQAAADEERRNLCAELRRRADTITQLSSSSSSIAQMNRENAAALVETLAAVRRMLTIMRLVGVEHCPDRFANGWLTAMTAAQDVVTKYDIPF